MNLFDWSWRFHPGDVEGGEKTGFDDTGWREVNLPHDWSIEGPFVHDIPTSEAMDEFAEKNWGVPRDESISASLQGYRPGGVGWYRKHFNDPRTAAPQRVFIQFDGVYMNADFWLNGRRLGSHPYGYTSFFYDLTPFLRGPGEENVLAVRVNVEQPCSRWYSGAGIYRHVWLAVVEPVHVAPWGVYVTTPEVSDAKATVRVKTEVVNQADEEATISLETTIINEKGDKVASMRTEGPVEPGASADFDQSFRIPDPDCWAIDRPCMYRAVSLLKQGDTVVDEITTPFGIRTFEFTDDRGFFLNGKHVPLQGVNMHHDQGCLGAAAYDRAIERQLEILKDMGCNAIRTAHNPPAPILLDLCDRMGFIVMDEIFDEWKDSKMPYGYGRFFDEWSERDLVSMIRRDRNHPSIVMWSIGNEIPEQTKPEGAEMAKRLADICRREDPTRPVTSGCNHFKEAQKTGYSDALDIVSVNYDFESLDRMRGKAPTLASETTVALSTRGEYNLAIEDGVLQIKPRIGHVFSSYDVVSLSFAEVALGAPAGRTLKAIQDRPWVAGQFVWSGFDYLGEPLPVQWPARSSYFGIIDLCGFPKDRFYIYQSQWTDKPVLHLLPHWNWPQFNGLNMPVWCFTNCEAVELLLNGESMGVKQMADAEDLRLEWSVPYKSGTLKAVGMNNGDVVCSREVHTAGQPAQVALRVDRDAICADGQDLAYVTASILDDQGRLCPNADNSITFTAEGPATLAGVGNGNPISLERFDVANREAFHGLGLAVIRASREPGQVAVKATAEGLQSAEIFIKIK